MVSVRPFPALYYNPQKIKNLKDVFVPPYDVISEKEKEAYFKKSSYNFARIILGKNAQDGYATAAREFKNWQKQGVLLRDSHSCFYFWEQKFYHSGKKKYVKRGQLVSAISLSDFKKGAILPHEKTLDAPKSDRLEILKACKANLSPVFMMVEDPQFFLQKTILKHCKKPFIKTKDSQGILNTIWRIEDIGLQKTIQDFFLKKKVYLIDGHHRFATALNYEAYLKEQGLLNPSAQYILTAITNMNDPSLVIDPIYRALSFHSSFEKETYLDKLYVLFHIQKRKGIVALKKNEWGILFGKDSYFYILKIKNKTKLFSQMQGPSAIKDLDVSVLQQIIIPKAWHADLTYIRGVGEPLKLAIQKCKKGEFQCLWFVKEAQVKQVKKISDIREIMPPKSTYFYPKVLSGPLIRLV